MSSSFPIRRNGTSHHWLGQCGVDKSRDYRAGKVLSGIGMSQTKMNECVEKLSFMITARSVGEIKYSGYIVTRLNKKAVLKL